MSNIYNSVYSAISTFTNSITVVINTVKLCFDFLPVSTLTILVTGLGFLLLVSLYKGIRG